MSACTQESSQTHIAISNCVMQDLVLVDKFTADMCTPLGSGTRYTETPALQECKSAYDL